MPNECWSPASWRGKPVEQVPVYADKPALAEVESQLAGFRRSSSRARRASLSECWAGRRGRSIPFARRRLRRELRRTRGRQYPRFFPGVSANGRGYDLRRGLLSSSLPHRRQFAKPRSAPNETIDGSSCQAIAAIS